MVMQSQWHWAEAIRLLHLVFPQTRPGWAISNDWCEFRRGGVAGEQRLPLSL